MKLLSRKIIVETGEDDALSEMTFTLSVVSFSLCGRCDRFPAIENVQITPFDREEEGVEYTDSVVRMRRNPDGTTLLISPRL